jgi:hypothetical protein
MKRHHGLTIALLLLAYGCTEFSTRYENIQFDKIRPLAVICEPAEAAPGDTVSIRFFAVFPKGVPALTWTVALDYGMDLYGNEVVERHVVPLESIRDTSAPDSLGLSFRIVVPESTLLYSTQLSGLIKKGIGVPAGLTLETVDSLMKALPVNQTMIPATLIDQFATNIKLRCHMESDITLDVTKLLTVRYSRKFNSPNVNENPRIRWIGVVTVKARNVTSPDSIGNFKKSFQYLYSRDSDSLVNDTVVVEDGYSYFLAADSGKSGPDPWKQTYTYISNKDGTEKTDSVFYSYDWLYSNLDYTSAMKMDSLILMPGEREAPLVNILPPVDTRMRKFQFYTVVGGTRMNDLMLSTGADYKTVTGVFRYTDAYKRAHGQ